MSCSPRLETDRLGYVVTGECLLPGGRLRCVARFGCNETVEASHFSAGACSAFRTKVLAVFGPGGSRSQPGGQESGFMPPELSAALLGTASQAHASPADRIADFCREGLGFRPPPGAR